MNIEVSRRHFLKLAGAGAAGSAIAAFGFGEAEAQVAAHVRPYKLASATETRNTCPYCSVACGVIMYSRGDLKKGEKADILHIEGDSDHPTNRGTLCPKGAALLDFVKAPTRTTVPATERGICCCTAGVLRVASLKITSSGAIRLPSSRQR